MVEAVTKRLLAPPMISIEIYGIQWAMIAHSRQTKPNRLSPRFESRESECERRHRNKALIPECNASGCATAIAITKRCRSMVRKTKIELFLCGFLSHRLFHIFTTDILFHWMTSRYRSIIELHWMECGHAIFYQWINEINIFNFEIKPFFISAEWIITIK